MDGERIAAMRRAIALGRTLQMDIGSKLSEFYRQGGTILKAVEKFDILSEYNVTNSVAWASLRFALSGFDGKKLDVQAYEGLISDPKERAKIAKEHMTKNSKAMGKLTYQLGKGIHGLSAEERTEIARKNGLKNGSALGRGRAIAQGFSIYSEGERKLAYLLRQESYFRDGSILTNSMVKQIINDVYHDGRNVRTTGAIRQAQVLYKRSLEGKAQTS